MKKKLVVLFILFISIFITGCGKSIVGEYKIVEIKENNSVLKEKDLKKNNINYSIIVNKDKTAILTISEKEKVKYDDKYFYREEDETDKVAYKFDGKNITIKIDELELVFKKR